MAHFDSSREIILKYDASDDTTASVLSQFDNEGILYPVAFYSASLGPTKRNYAIYDKEMLAIVKAFKE